jgi:hypothetical protein
LKRLFTYIILLFYIGLANVIQGQGINTEFGQNRLNSNKTEWNILSDVDINVLYYKGGKDHAEFAWKQYQLLLTEVQKILRSSISGVTNIVVYNNLSDYLKGNIGIVNPEYNYAGQTKMINNRMVLYYNGGNYDFTKQIKKEIARIIINEMLYGGSLNERLQNAALMVVSDWFIEGLAEYIGKGWDTEIDDWSREFFLNTNFTKMEDLSYEDRIKAGRSVWHYLYSTEGKKVIPDVLFQTRVSDNYEAGIVFATGQALDGFYHKWFAYYKSSYQLEVSRTISAFGKEKVPERLKKLPNTQFKISPNGELAAFVVNDKGKYTIWLHNFSTSKSTKILSGGHKIINKGIDYNLPIIDWKKSDNSLGVLVYDKGYYELVEYQISKSGATLSKNSTNKNSPLARWTYINDFCYSYDGNDIFISMNQSFNDNGRGSGIYWLKADKNKPLSFDKEVQITSLNHTKKHLRPINPEELIFIEEEYTMGDNFPKYHVEIVDINTRETKIIFTSQSKETIKQPMVLSKDYYIFLSDRSGIFNSYILPKENSQNAEPLAISNYNRSILFQDINLNSKIGADMLYENQEYHIISYSLAENPLEDTKGINIKKTFFAKSNSSIKKVKKTNAKDSAKTIEESDIIAYNTKIQTGFEKIDFSELAPEEKLELQDGRFTHGKYNPRFQVDYVTTQFDNSILGSYYSPAELHPKHLVNGIFNSLLKLNISDITNDYTLDGGVRINSFLNGGTVFLNAGILKGRIDKKFHFYRRSLLIETEEVVYKRNISSGGEVTLAYPFNETLRLEVSGSMRSDKVIVLSGSSRGGLTNPGTNNLYAGLKSKMVYDNTESKGLNNITGQRGSAFMEKLTGVNGKINILNLGLDIRNYQRIHRNIIFATRGVFNSSIGIDKVLYRLGGMENWVSPSLNESNIENSDYTDYKLQTNANNLRGFSLNEQKGNSYFILNNEIRIPIVSYLYRRNIRSNFLKNIFIVPFFDLGAGWSGNSPWSIENPNNVITYNFDIYTIKVRAARNPILYSTGFGLRSKVLGYLLKYDYGVGYKDNKSQDGVHHFSLGVDF